jgi:hypothetical protein
VAATRLQMSANVSAFAETHRQMFDMSQVRLAGRWEAVGRHGERWSLPRAGRRNGRPVHHAVRDGDHV